MCTLGCVLSHDVVCLSCPGLIPTILFIITITVIIMAFGKLGVIQLDDARVQPGKLP